MKQIFACEINPEKRALIRKQNPKILHLFSDVRVFSEGRGYCEVCNADHTIDDQHFSIDVLFSGPSCKDISRLNSKRGSFVGTYSHKGKAEVGTSGPTYEHGYRAVTWRAVPPLLVAEPDFCKFQNQTVLGSGPGFLVSDRDRLVSRGILTDWLPAWHLCWLI